MFCGAHDARNSAGKTASGFLGSISAGPARACGSHQLKRFV
jgi:hypothetical protein